MLANLSLRVRLFLVFVPLFAVFVAFNYGLIIAHEQKILTEEMHLRAVAIARVLAASSAYSMAALNTHDLELAVDQVKTLRDVSDVLVVDKDGRIEASPDVGSVGSPSRDALVAQVLRGPAVDEPVLSTDEASGMLRVAAPVIISGKVEGAVSVVMSLTSLRAAVAQSRTYVLMLTALLIAVVLLFVVVAAHWFTGPILRLARVARAIADGDIDRRAEVRGRDEIGVLGEAFNEMSARLAGMMENEKHAHEDLQRRVGALLERTERVAAGDLDGPEAPESPDEMGRLAAGFNDMVRNLRHHTRIQQATLFELEESSRALAEANQQLKEMDRLKSEFLDTVSHELRTPLTSIKAFSEILLDSRGDDPDTLTEFLGIINQESDRLTRLINNLLDLSRIEAGRMQWEMETLDLREVAASCLATTRALADKRGVTLSATLPDALLVVGDRDKWTQVVTNLLSNAIKFTREGGQVSLSATCAEGRIELRVRDTGVGIPAEHLERIFEKFQQVDNSSTREVKGSGLGLPIVRSIVEAHGGEITVESEAGKGSTFSVRVPAADSDANRGGEGVREALPEEDLPAASELAGARRAQRVLVVDDEANIVRLIRHVLEAEGFTVLEALSGEEGLRRARAERPDLMLLDVLLPDVGGLDVLAQLRTDAAFDAMPVVVLSVLEAKEEAFLKGAQDYCSKPIDRARLLEVVQSLLDGTASPDEPRCETEV